MNRLTIRNSDGAWDVPLRNDDDGTYIPSQEIIDRLAAYEDTGLEPEEVERYAKAEKEGLLVLPCKVGDTVYYHFQFKNKRVLPFTRKAKVKKNILQTQIA